jgi:hypothetical protein
VASGRNKYSKGDDNRLPGGFAAIPWQVLDSQAYLQLTANARSLLLEVARQLGQTNNGTLLLSRAYLRKRGWNSADMLTKAKKELLEHRFIHETVKGCRPNKASWYAVTWYRLDRHPKFDPGAFELFERGAFRTSEPLKTQTLDRPAVQKALP